jgi:DNA (cytosine-5)-methyltransferase 1
VLSVGSLFSGIGGFDLGFERAGCSIAWQVEIDPWARAVLTKHWPTVPKHADIRDVGRHNLGPVDILCGGFPCQDISLAGKGAGIAEGTRSGLWSEYVRLIRELRPRYVVVENVAALKSRGLDRVLGDLAASGYDAEWDCIPACAIGAPHRRDRLWIVAYPAGVQQQPRCEPSRADDARHPGARPVSGPAGGPALLAHPLHHRRQECPLPEGQEWRPVSDAAGRGGAGADVADTLSDARLPRRLGDPSQSTRGRDAGRSALGTHGSHWTVEPAVGRVAHGIPARVDRLRGLGNAIVPQIAEWIARRILARESELTPDALGV